MGLNISFYHSRAKQTVPVLFARGSSLSGVQPAFCACIAPSEKLTLSVIGAGVAPLLSKPGAWSQPAALSTARKNWLCILAVLCCYKSSCR